MKVNKSITDLRKAIGTDAIIGSIITVVLIAGVVIGIFRMRLRYDWKELIDSSKETYEYTSYKEDYVKGVEEEVSSLYKNARVLYGYSDINNLSLENYSSGNIMLYGWEENNSKKLTKSIEVILEDIDVLENKTSFTSKEKEIITESLEMIRYFCDNQQVINKVRLEMKLTGELTKSSSNLNIQIIGDGGKDYLKGYEEQINSLKGKLK